RSMRRIDQPELLKVGHHVAHRGRRQRHRDQARNVARTDRFAGCKVAFDNLPENIARPLIQLGKPGTRRDQMRIISNQIGLRLGVRLCPFLGSVSSTYGPGPGPLVPSPCRSVSARLKAPPTIILSSFGELPMRPSRRAPDELRAVTLERGVV